MFICQNGWCIIDIESKSFFLRFDQFSRGFDLFLLFLNLFESIKFLSFSFIQFGSNVIKSSLNLGNYNMFKCINSSICYFDHVIQCNETCLKRSQFNEQLNGFGVIFLQLC